MLFKRKLRERPSSDSDTIMDRPLWWFLGSIGDFFILTIYWIFTSLPLVTIGASTTALFYVCMKLRAREEGKLWQMYKKSFTENFKQATFIWLLYVFIALDVFLVGYTMCQRGVFAAADFSIHGGKYYYTLLIVCLVYLSIMIYTAALLAMFKQTTSQCLIAAVGLAFGRLPSTLLFLVILWVLAMLTVNLFPFLILIDVPMAVYLITIRMSAIFQKQIDRVEKRDQQNDGSEGEFPEE